MRWLHAFPKRSEQDGWKEWGSQRTKRDNLPENAYINIWINGNNSNNTCDKMPEKQTKTTQKNNTDEAGIGEGFKHLSAAIGVNPESLKAELKKANEKTRKDVEKAEKEAKKANEWRAKLRKKTDEKMKKLEGK